MNLETVQFDAEDSDPERINVQILEFTDANTETGLKPGFYFGFPDLSGELPGTEIFLEGPYPTREGALAAAGQYIIDAVQAHANGDLGDLT